MTDNFLVALDDDGGKALGVLATNEKPDTKFLAEDGAALKLFDIKCTDIPNQLIYLAVIPYADVATMFEESESATLGGGAASGADGTASGGNRAELDAQNEYVRHDLVAGTDIEEGRYLAVLRIYDANQVAGDVELQLYNRTDSAHRSELNTVINLTAGAAWAFLCYAFDVHAQDVTDGDTISVDVKKDLADANTIYVDYLLVVPLGDGEGYPQDIAHNTCFRAFDFERRVEEI
jgi:hypothetical protein